MGLTRIQNDTLAEFYISERVYVREIFNDPTSVSLARCRVEPGVTTVLHSLKGTREIYVIEDGQGKMEDGNAIAFDVVVGDAVNIEPDHPQRITNTGEVDLVFLVICTPGFMPENYCDLENSGGFSAS